MPKRISKQKRPKRPKDVNEWARRMVEESTENSQLAVSPSEPTPSQISAVMAVLGRKGGQIGGKRRLETLTPAERSEFASKAAKARWGKR